jgi:hypothetical protein
MNKYLVAALSIAVAIGPASALDVGVGGKVGGIGVGAGLGLGKGGASVKGGLGIDKVGRADVDGSVGASRGKGVSANVGAGAKVDGVGGANLGGSLGVNRGSLDAGLGVSGNLGGKSGSLGADVGLGGKSSNGGSSGTAPGESSGGSSAGLSAGSGRSAGGSTGRGGGSGSATDGSGASAGIGQSKGARNIIVALPGALMPHFRIVLPRSLGPSGRSTSARGTWGYPLLPKIVWKPGTSDAVVRVCRQAIFSAAKPLGAVGVHAVSAGPVRRQRNGLTAPLSVRIDYGKEVRQAKVGCRLDAAGRVIGVT